MQKQDKIYVAGHRGLVGSAIVRMLERQGFTNILTRTREQLDLIDQKAVESFFDLERPDYVFDAAAKVGGIHSNNTYSADFIYQNIQIQSNLIHYAHKFQVKKFLFMGSVCIYPKFAPTPVSENCLMTGPLEPTNDAYAVAKISGIKMCESYHKQYGFRSVSVMPSNMYGPGDNFHPENGHVIPAMITKFHNATQDTITLWGDGSPCREFLYVDDMASACIFLIQHPDTGSAELINVGSGDNISIRQLASLIQNLTQYSGNIIWDTTKPNGTPNRPLNFDRIRAMGWQPSYNLQSGLSEMYKWYLDHYHTTRSV
jgi:GDP-L-fucose synthase